MKQVQVALADAKCQELFDNLRREREMISPTPQDWSNSRKSAVKVIGPDENLFRMDWVGHDFNPWTVAADEYTCYPVGRY